MSLELWKQEMRTVSRESAAKFIGGANLSNHDLIIIEACINMLAEALAQANGRTVGSYFTHYERPKRGK